MKIASVLLTCVILSITVNGQIQKIKTTREPATTVKPILVDQGTIKNTVLTNPVYDFRDVSICVDQPATTNILPPRRSTAGPTVPRINSDGSLSGVSSVQQGLVGATEKMWNPGDVITVYLSPNNGSDRMRERVKNYVKEWERVANIKFEFISNFSTAQIKVNFKSNGQNWSWIGRDVLVNPMRAYTMNFGSFDHATPEATYSRLILHEFGHALGFHHEHQSPASPLQWDLPKTYAYFKEQEKWTADEVNRNVIDKYLRSNTNFSAYDPRSIMHYGVPKGLTTSGERIEGNYMLSSTDSRYAGYWYPFPAKGINTQGNLRTNDDCDDVFFKVEYDVVAGDQVEFNLSLGEANGEKVSWWKQIEIPLNGNRLTKLQVQNHSLIASENRISNSIQIAFSELDNTRGINFWKAKFLGVHTLLNYKWNVMPALRGGCRVTLSWNRDNCL